MSKIPDETETIKSVDTPYDSLKATEQSSASAGRTVTRTEACSELNAGVQESQNPQSAHDSSATGKKRDSVNPLKAVATEHANYSSESIITMRKQDVVARNDMLRLLHDRRPGFSLEQPFYTDPEFFKLDMELIWYRDWLFIGHDCELPKPGSFITVQVGAYPVVLVRDQQGNINAFHNSCRHRGSRICKTDKGTAAKLVCPYHQWTYELDGRMLFARNMADGFDKSQFGLKPVACESVGGYIFICLAKEPADFAPMRAMIEPYLLPHRLSDAKVAFESTVIEKGNWKLVWENNKECYHCAANHPELCRTLSEAPTSNSAYEPENDPELQALWANWEAAGLPSKFRIDPAGQYRATRTPLLRDAVSFTMTGKRAVRQNLSDVSAERIGTLALYHYPSTWNHVLGDHAVTFRVLPISATETALTTKWLVHKDAVEGVDYDLDELTHVWAQTNDQDRRIVEENAFGILSPAYEPGPYSELYEGSVIQFNDWYARFIGSRLAEGGQPLRGAV
ncbi:aromatic ring-hydroxylating oxygenase subunit alpha [Paraburkholderia aspalathi]|uniref:Rieske 2Fe-2S family protein n=1 Tax=Paraburkholderia aspalathi TaxID=1324617 RepID=A0A1I7B951_9BURK|nr:aromatic ring-hydroxylating dioxygenase subunit alpha [Paraburkholderia aspalathi]SFT83697.1 Rieske 2Fe-2S family protein [Paraburkholderia aspalathi]